jgi:16S rRNA (adenine1518-N6/adenine1519-N6)-dimethyltransferase
MSLPPLNVPELLRQYGLRPDKSLGQNFLVDPAALARVVEVAQVGPDQAVLEIGPGLGSLTRLLAVQARRVVAVELDSRLIPALQAVLAPFSNVQVVQGDILAVDLNRLMLSSPEPQSLPYQVVANIPYYITSAVIRHLLEAPRQPERAVLTVQSEVAERLCASPGDLSLLALSVQVYGAPHLAGRIPAGSFYPAPQVDSAIVRIDLYPQPVIPVDHLKTFFRLAKAGFSQKRKNLRNSISGGMGWTQEQAVARLQAAGIDPRRRAETLTLEEWRALTQITRDLP